VITAALLLAYAACVGVLGPLAARRSAWHDRAPMLAIVSYLTAAWSVIAATALAGLTLAVHATALGGGLSYLVGACVQRLRDTYATPGGTSLAAGGLGLAGLVLLCTVATGAARLRTGRRAALRHAETARLVGQEMAELAATVVDDPRPAAYCLPGPQPTIVLTTGTLQLLDDAQLAAVLAHERAHLASRHHLLMAMARTGRMVFPFIPLMREADTQVARLAELHADDAARAGDSGPLATALVILATGGSIAPAAMAAAANDVVQRVTRLLRPARPLGPRRRLLLGAAVLALAIIPVLLALIPALLALALGPVPAA
jgi:beta-lactamase regulating signal transducer with metallopeptidase domain